MCISDLLLDRIKASNDRGRAVPITQECEHEIRFPQQQSEQDFLASTFLAYDSVHLSDVRIWIRFDVCKEGNIVTSFPAMMGINACIHIVPVLGTLWIPYTFWQVTVVYVEKVLINIAVTGRTADAKFLTMCSIDVSDRLSVLFDQRNQDMIEMIDACRASPGLPRQLCSSSSYMRCACCGE
jgi:hypothetical protein